MKDKPKDQGSFGGAEAPCLSYYGGPEAQLLSSTLSKESTRASTHLYWCVEEVEVRKDRIYGLYELLPAQVRPSLTSIED